MELGMFELEYNEAEDKWEGVFYDEDTGEDIKVFRPFSYEIEYVFHKESKAIIQAIETIMLFHGDSPKIIINVQEMAIGSKAKEALRNLITS